MPKSSVFSFRILHLTACRNTKPTPVEKPLITILHAGNDSGKKKRNMAAMNVPGFQDQFWSNGPSPGAFYNFPGNPSSSRTAEKFSPAKRTL